MPRRLLHERYDPASDGAGSADGAKEPALEELYERYAPMVERWVGRLAGPSADLEDLVHDVFVVAFRRRTEFRGDAKLSTWLFRITEHVVKKRRFRDRVGALFGRRYQQALHAVAPPSVTPVEDAQRRQETGRLYRALDRLAEKDRTVIILYDLDGHSAQEVGELLGIQANAVWVRVHRARARLLLELEAQGKQGS